MAEYIERIDTFSDKMCEGIDCGVCPFYNKAGENDCQVVAFLRSIPAADVRPVVRGRWISHDFVDMGKGRYTGSVECSACGRFLPLKENYCPNCGAWMGKS
jgi:hypothetical protein